MKMPEQIGLMLELNKLEEDADGIDKTEVFKDIAKNLDPSLLKLYLKLKERRGTGTAVLRDGMCSECMLIYPDAHEVLRCRNTINLCEFCGRLLVVTEKAG